MKSTFALLILVAACGQPHAAAPTPVATLCDAAAGNVAKIIARNSSGGEPVAANSSTVGVMRDAVTATCTKDGWSSSASMCFRDIGALESVDVTATPCGQQLTEDQRKDLNAAMFTALMTAGSASGASLSDVLGTSAPADSLESLGSSGGGSVGSGNPASSSPISAPAPSSPPPTQSNPDDGGGYTPK